ncbi:MAG TPA: glycosyltransferase family 2 protein [Pseudomonadales bacterium]|nr:glycosyltransferase family 2 protein [Pseudomonadales bacterium]
MSNTEIVDDLAPHDFALSIVVPVYNGAASVPALVEALSQLQIDGGLEIVLVNDGSPDNSLAVCRDLCKRNAVALTVVNLARNFGEHNAVMAGYTHARGEYIINMDDDLQNPPEEVIHLWQHTKINNFDAVYTFYEHKQHDGWRNLGSRFTNWCADVVIDKPKGLYLSSFRCVHAFLAQAVIEHSGPFPYIDGLIFQITQNVGTLAVKHLPRVNGASNYTMSRLLRLFLSMLLNFSVLPLRIGTLTGVLLAGVGVVGLLAIMVEALLTDTPRGWASMMAGVLTLTGVQLMMLGIIGEYLGRMFLTINKKPQFVVRNVERNAKARRSR